MWAEQIGISLVVPSDRVDGDGRNYMVIGEDVPAEIAAKIKAGIVFRNAAHDTVQVNYWVLGISDIGSLEIVCYYQNVTFNAQGNMVTVFQRQTVLAMGASTASDGGGIPVVQVGGSPLDGYGSFNEAGEVDLIGRLASIYQIYVNNLLNVIGKVRINGGDAGLGQVNHAIGITDANGQIEMRIDNNEIMSVNLASDAGPETYGTLGLWEPRINTPQATAGSAPARKDYVDGNFYTKTQADANYYNKAYVNALIQRGQVTINPVANTATSAHVTFSPAFSGTPTVMVTANTGTNNVTSCTVNNVTSTGCDVWLVRTNTTATGVYWFASNG